jgi:histone acetyltransferase
VQAQTAPVSLPPPTEKEREDMKPPDVNGVNGHDVVVKVEDAMDESQLDKLVTGVTVDASSAASTAVRSFCFLPSSTGLPHS